VVFDLINIKHIVLGGLLVCLSVVFQLIPVVFGEIFVFATMLSALPIFILAKINPKAGLIAFTVAGILILVFNIHEGIFFIFTNGPVGLALGILNYYTELRVLISAIAGFILASTLSILNFAIGIPVFRATIPGNFVVQIIILILFSILYCFIYLFVANSVLNLLNKRYPII